jgi:hypothetical protein
MQKSAHSSLLFVGFTWRYDQSLQQGYHYSQIKGKVSFHFQGSERKQAYP